MESFLKAQVVLEAAGAELVSSFRQRLQHCMGLTLEGAYATNAAAGQQHAGWRSQRRAAHLGPAHSQAAWRVLGRGAVGLRPPDWGQQGARGITRAAWLTHGVACCGSCCTQGGVSLGWLEGPHQ